MSCEPSEPQLPQPPGAGPVGGAEPMLSGALSPEQFLIAVHAILRGGRATDEQRAGWVPLLAGMLEGTNALVMQMAAEALWELADLPEAFAALDDAVTRELWVYEAVSDRVLDARPTDRPHPARFLGNLLRCSVPWLRLHAARGLLELGPDAEEALDALVGALEEADWRVCVTAARTLAEIGPSAAAAVPALQARLAAAVEYEEVEVADAVRDALSRIRGEI